MDYRLLTTDSPSWIKRYSHRRRFEIAARLLQLQPSDRFLDFGAGDGYLMSLLHETCVSAEVTAFDPDPEMTAALQELPGIKVVSDSTELPSGQFDKVGCFEVMEHIHPDELPRLLTEISRLVSPTGTVLISVPIEIGLPALLKNAARGIIGQPHHGSSLRNVLRSFLRMNISRSTEFYWGHIGFDHRKLLDLLQSKGWKISKTVASPWPLFGTSLNSQLFLVATIERRTGTRDP
jgi:SAM-dependent methyltransferase